MNNYDKINKIVYSVGCLIPDFYKRSLVRILYKSCLDAGCKICFNEVFKFSAEDVQYYYFNRVKKATLDRYINIENICKSLQKVFGQLERNYAC